MIDKVRISVNFSDIMAKRFTKLINDKRIIIIIIISTVKNHFARLYLPLHPRAGA